MESIKETEIQYCTSCGAVNKKSAVLCVECKKKITLRHRPVVDFLKKRVKGRAAGKVREKLFELIKDFLIEHLYGVILTVSVGLAATTAAVTATPYVQTVTAPPFEKAVISEVPAVNEEIKVTEEVEEEPEVDPDYAYWCESHAIVMMSYYMDYTDYVIWAHDGYTLSPDNIPLEEIYAETVIPGFNHQGVHEMMTERIPLGIYHNGSSHKPLGMSDIEGCVEGSFKFGENVSSPFGQTLYAEGYEIMECNYAISLYEGLEVDGTLQPEPVEEEVFRVLFVRYEDSWYIAEEVLVDRIKGETYDLYMQYGPNGIVTIE